MSHPSSPLPPLPSVIHHAATPSRITPRPPDRDAVPTMLRVRRPSLPDLRSTADHCVLLRRRPLLL